MHQRGEVWVHQVPRLVTHNSIAKDSVKVHVEVCGIGTFTLGLEETRHQRRKCVVIKELGNTWHYSKFVIQDGEQVVSVAVWST